MSVAEFLWKVLGRTAQHKSAPPQTSKRSNKKRYTRSYSEAKSPKAQVEGLPPPLRLNSAPDCDDSCAKDSDISVGTFVTFKPGRPQYSKAMLHLTPGQEGQVVGCIGKWICKVRIQGRPDPIDVEACDLEHLPSDKVSFSFLAETLQNRIDAALAGCQRANR